MKQFTTKGIVLARVDYGEADRITTFLTPQHGKVRAMCKGVRKPKSKLAGGIELFSLSDLTLIKGRGDMDTLVSSRLEKHFGNIVTDINRTMLGYDLLKIMNKILEDEGGEEFFEVMQDSLEALNNLDMPPELAETSFLMRLMQLLGHQPNLVTDLEGNKLTKEDAYQFSFEDMAFSPHKNGNFGQNHIKLLRLLSYNKPAALLQVKELGAYVRELAPLVRNISRQYVVNF